jgi:hypothetical protein
VANLQASAKSLRDAFGKKAPIANSAQSFFGAAKTVQDGLASLGLADSVATSSGPLQASVRSLLTSLGD